MCRAFTKSWIQSFWNVWTTWKPKRYISSKKCIGLQHKHILILSLFADSSLPACLEATIHKYSLMPSSRGGVCCTCRNTKYCVMTFYVTCVLCPERSLHKSECQSQTAVLHIITNPTEEASVTGRKEKQTLEFNLYKEKKGGEPQMEEAYCSCAESLHHLKTQRTAAARNGLASDTHTTRCGDGAVGGKQTMYMNEWCVEKTKTRKGGNNDKGCAAVRVWASVDISQAFPMFSATIRSSTNYTVHSRLSELINLTQKELGTHYHCDCKKADFNTKYFFHSHSKCG